MKKKKLETPAQNTAARQDYQYGRYRIISALMQDKYHAYVYTGSKVIIKMIGDDSQSLTQELKATVDAHIQELQAKRDTDGVPSATEYGEALASIMQEPLKRQLAKLKSRINTQGNRMAIKDLVREMDYETLDKADNIFIQISRQLIRFMDFNPAADLLPTKLQPIHVLALPQAQRSDGVWEWELRPQLVEALKEYGN